MLGTNIRKRLIGGVVWGFAAKVIALLAGLFTTMLLARMLSLADMGVYILVASVIKFTSVVGQLGLGRVGVRRVSEALAITGQEAAARIGIDVIRMGLLGAMLIILIVHFAIVPWVERVLPAARGLGEVGTQVMFWSITVVGTALVAQVQRGFHNMRLSSMFGGAIGPTLIVISYLVVLLLGTQITLNLVTTMAAGVNALTFIIAFSFLFPHLRHVQQTQAGAARRLFDDSWPFWLASVGSMILAQSAVWVVGTFHSSEEVAIYGAAVSLFSLASLPTSVISSVLQPTISDLHARGSTAKLEKAVRMSNIFATLPSMLMLVVFVLLAGNCLSLVYGEAYREGEMALAILSMGNLAAAVFGMPALLLHMMDHERIVMNAVLGFGVLTILGAVFGAGHFGIAGVAGAIAGGTLLQRAFLWRQAHIRLGMRTDILTLNRSHFRGAIHGLSGIWQRASGKRDD